jgi:hypothetical protein
MGVLTAWPRAESDRRSIVQCDDWRIFAATVLRQCVSNPSSEAQGAPTMMPRSPRREECRQPERRWPSGARVVLCRAG